MFCLQVDCTFVLDACVWGMEWNGERCMQIRGIVCDYIHGDDGCEACKHSRSRHYI